MKINPELILKANKINKQLITRKMVDFGYYDNIKTTIDNEDEIIASDCLYCGSRTFSWIFEPCKQCNGKECHHIRK